MKFWLFLFALVLAIQPAFDGAAAQLPGPAHGVVDAARLLDRSSGQTEGSPNRRARSWFFPKAVHNVSDGRARIPIVITTRGGPITIDVEVARTAAQQQRGLMFRRSLPERTGMIFLYEPPQPVAMWMRNTLISLDMLFVARDGTIVRIAERTEPFSERIISSGRDVSAVLEIEGGASRTLGIAVGDMIELSGLLR